MTSYATDGMRARRVVVVSRSVPPDVGGYQSQFKLVLPALQTLGFRITAFGGIMQNPKDEHVGWPRVPTRALRVHWLPRRLKPLGYPVILVRALWCGLVGRARSEEVTLLLLSPTMPGADRLIRIWGRALGPVVVRFPTAGDAALLFSRYTPGCDGRPVRWVAISPEQQAELDQLGIESTLIPNAVALKTSRNVRVDNRAFVFVGRLVARKRVLLVAEAWRQLQDQLPDWTMQIIGGGQGDPESVEHELRRLAEGVPRLELLGEVRDARSLLGAGDLLVHPSAVEGLPNTVLEAMAAGVAVIADTAAMRRWFPVVPPHVEWDGSDAESLARAMVWAAENGSEVAHIARGARRMIERCHSLTSATTRYAQLLAGVD